MAKKMRVAPSALWLGGATILLAVVFLPAAALGSSKNTGPGCTKARWGSFSPTSGSWATPAHAATRVTIRLTQGVKVVTAVLFSDGHGSYVEAEDTATDENGKIILADVPLGAVTGPITLQDQPHKCVLKSPRSFTVK